MKKNAVPRYFCFSPFLAAGIIYTLFVLNIFLNISMNRLPQFLEHPRFQEAFRWEREIETTLKEGGGMENLPAPPLPADWEKPLFRSLEGQVDTIIILLIIGGLTNLPLGLYFFKKRRGRPVKEGLTRWVRKILPLTPWINSGLILLGFNLFHLAQKMDQPHAAGAFRTGKELFWEMMPISIIASILAALFVFFWQTYRVHMVYQRHVYPLDQMLKRRSTSRLNNIALRLSLTTLVTALLPTVTIIIYITFNISSIRNISALSPQQMELIGGEIFPIARSLGKYGELVDWLKNQEVLEGLHYMTIPGTIRMLFSIVVGLTVALLYIIFFVKWNTRLLLEPIQDLMTRMDETARGDFSSPARVTTNDEIGYLTEHFNEMQRGLAERERVKTLFGQYLTTEVSEAILNGQADLGGRLITATILFADIRNFTGISEELSPRDTVAFLNEYLNEMIEVVLQERGIIDKFIGDGLLAVFGAPVASADHAEQALQAALGMHGKLEEMNQRRRKAGTFPINIGIGIHSGPVIAGNLGNANKLEYTVIGDTVNLASRIEGLTKEHRAKILVSRDTWNLTSQAFRQGLNSRVLQNVTVRGKKAPVSLYRIEAAG